MSTGAYKIRNRKSYITKDVYNSFILKHPEHNITFEDFKNIVKESNICIKELILTNELGFKMPYNLGYICVSKFKQKKDYKVIDWINTNKLGKIVPLLNMHSFGNMFKITLFKNRRIFPLRFFDFKAHRIINRELASKIKSGYQNYVELKNSYFNTRFNIERKLKQNN